MVALGAEIKRSAAVRGATAAVMSATDQAKRALFLPRPQIAKSATCFPLRTDAGNGRAAVAARTVALHLERVFCRDLKSRIRLLVFPFVLTPEVEGPQSLRGLPSSSLSEQRRRRQIRQALPFRRGFGIDPGRLGAGAGTGEPEPGRRQQGRLIGPRQAAAKRARGQLPGNREAAACGLMVGLHGFGLCQGGAF